MKIKHKYLNLPLTVQLEITDKCNHECIYCYGFNPNKKQNKQTESSDEVLMKCVQEIIDNKIFSVTITGGEPLLKKELTIKVLSLLIENNIKVSINSNIVLLDDNFLNFLQKHNIGVLASCPSAIPTSYNNIVGRETYHIFEKNLKKIISAKIPLAVNMVVTQKNIKDIEFTAKRMKELGCKHFAATPVSLNMNDPQLDLMLDKKNVKQLISELLRIEKELDMQIDILEAIPKCIFDEKTLLEPHPFLGRKCQAGRTTATISPSGELRPCSHNSNSYGNILNENFRTIWSNMSDWRSKLYLPEECINCKWVHRCNGGCRTNAKTYCGEWDSMDYLSTGPIKIEPRVNKNEINIYPDTLLQMSSDLLVRQEDELTYVVYNFKDNDYCMINNKLYSFVDKLKLIPNKVYFKDLQRKFNINDSNYGYFIDVISFLISKKILKEVKNGIN